MILFILILAVAVFLGIPLLKIIGAALLFFGGIIGIMFAMMAIMLVVVCVVGIVFKL